MRWSRYTTRHRLLGAAFLVVALAGWLSALPASAQADSAMVQQQADVSKYDQRMSRYRRQWSHLMPRQSVVQNAGNMGVLSAGVGWAYGRRRQWETHLLFGYIPKHQSTRGKLTTTLKENYLPWSLAVNEYWSVEPLTASLYLNTVYGHEFWRTQPGRYPDDYYELMSTKFRINVALGQQVTCHIPQARRKFAKSISLFYEIGTCDLYIRSKVLEHSIPLKDIVGLSIGVKLRTL